MSSTDSYEYYEEEEYFDDNFDPDYDHLYYEPPSLPEISEPPPSIDELLSPPSIPDPAIAICHSLDQSKSLIQEHFGFPCSSLRHHNVSGLVVLPLSDINLIRKDTRSNREQKLIMIMPYGPDFDMVHSDLAQMIKELHQ